jgi:rubrerythrin
LSANERATVYTCSICGHVIRHLATFIRHKRGHEGIVYRCDICGVVLSRQDTLKVHRRKCLAKVEQKQ